MAVTKLVKNLFKNPATKSVALYIFSNFFSKGISFLLLPVFTNPRFLTPTDNGLLSIFSSNLVLLTPFIALGLRHSVNADFFNKSKHEFDKAFTTNFVLAFGLSLLAVLCLFIFRDILKQKFQFPESFIYVIPTLVFLTFCNDQLFTLLRVKNEANKYALFSFLKTVVEYGVSLLLIVTLFYGWKGRVWGIAASLVTINIVSLIYYNRNKQLKFSISAKHIWNEIKFGIPIIIFQVCVFTLGSTNKLFLVAFNVDKYQLGIYAVACIFGSVIGTVSQSILIHSQNKLYTSISSGNASINLLKKQWFTHLKLVVASALLCVLVVLFLYYFVINKIYLSGLPLFFLSALSSFIWGLNDYLFLFLLYYKAKKKILILSLISIACSLVVSIIMVKKFLIWGDAWAGVINTLIFGMILILILKDLIKTKFNNKLSAEVQQ